MMQYKYLVNSPVSPGYLPLYLPFYTFNTG